MSSYIKSKVRGEKGQQGIQLMPYAMPVFNARKTYKITPSGSAVFLAGDAKTGLSYRQGLNNGLIVGATLGHQLGAATRESLPKIAKRYETQANDRAKWQIRLAKIKNVVVSLANLYLTVSSCVPWQVNYWSKKDLKKVDTHIADREVATA